MPLSNQKRYRLARNVFLLALLLLAYYLYGQWQYIIVQVIEWQKVFHELLAEHVKAVSNDPLKHGVALILLSFGYGVFHAIGPGHGKAVIITYLGSHKESLRRGAVISLLAALLQSVVAVLLVIVFTRIISVQLSRVNNYADDITSVSYLLVSALGAFLFFTAFAQRWKLSHRYFDRHSDSKHIDHDHDHDHSCCGVQHVYQTHPKESVLKSIGVILSMGVRPCSGAIVVLIYAHLVDSFYYGVLATLFMGLGTGLSIAGIAVVTQLARNWIETFVTSVSNQNNSYLSAEVMLWLRMGGGGIIFLLGISLFLAVTRNTVSHPLL